MISTRGRYSLRVLVDLAQNGRGDFIPMKDVATRQNISLKYLEQILPILTKNKFVETAHGKGGGYRLAMEPSKIIIGDVLRLTEKDLAPVACLAEGAAECNRKKICPTLDFWQGLNDVINEYLNGKTIADLSGLPGN